MASRRASAASRPAPDTVLTKALLNARARLGLTQAELAEVIGVSASTFTRIANHETKVGPKDKSGQLAVLFLRVFRSLDALMGGNEESAKRWLRARNLHLHGVPVDLAKRPEGLSRVAEYLDAMRGEL